MRKIKRAVVILVCLLLAAVVLLFTLENKQPVEFSFLSFTSPELPLALGVLLAFVAGAFFAGLTFWLPLGHLRRKTAKQAKKLVRLQEELRDAKEAASQASAATGLVVSDNAA